DRLDDILSLVAPKAGSVQVRPIHPFADAPAKRVLVRAVKTGKAPLRLLPGLVLHERGRAHTPAADAILRGAAALSWLELVEIRPHAPDTWAPWPRYGWTVIAPLGSRTTARPSRPSPHAFRRRSPAAGRP